MKKLVLLSVISFIVLFCFGCEQNQNDTTLSENAISEESVFSDSDSDRTSEVNSNEVSEESRPRPEEIYPFLKSKYKVTSTMAAFGKLYVCEYYFVDGIVVGAKLMTTLETEEAADEYYEIIAEDFADAMLAGCTVTHFLDDDDNFYYGYTLEKLKFVLKKTGYEISVDFDEKEFNYRYTKPKTTE